MSKTWKPKQPNEVNRTARVKRSKAIERTGITEADQAIRETVHSAYSQRMYMNVYVYDRTEDGPEVTIIKAILATHYPSQLGA